MACVCGMQRVSFSRESFHCDQPSDPVFFRLYTEGGLQHHHQPQINLSPFNAAKTVGPSGSGNLISVITERSPSLPGRYLALLRH